MKTIGVTRFLGTNCDQDVFDAINSIDGLEAQWLWYEEEFETSKVDGVVVPGGFSYGDYLRPGALASKMPVMNSVDAFAKQGRPVLGICNGFQVLCERKLLPGALLKNKDLKFIDKWVGISSNENASSFWNLETDNFKLPIAHGDGRYYIDNNSLKTLIENEQVWLTYSDNPNGSVSDIAGVMNKEKNVAALMPHPERALYDWMGSSDGMKLLKGFLNA